MQPVSTIGPRQRLPKAAGIVVFVLLTLPGLVIMRSLYPAKAFGFWLGPGTFFAMVILVLVHEGCHVLVMRIAGTRARIGIQFRPFRVFTHSNGDRLARRAWVAAALAPAFVTIPIALALLIRHPAWPWVGLVTAGSVISCGRDVKWVLIDLPRHSKPGDFIEDIGQGFCVYRSL
jgi:hypothetical protein